MAENVQHYSTLMPTAEQATIHQPRNRAIATAKQAKCQTIELTMPTVPAQATLHTIPTTRKTRNVNVSVPPVAVPKCQAVESNVPICAPPIGAVTPSLGDIPQEGIQTLVHTIPEAGVHRKNALELRSLNGLRLHDVTRLEDAMSRIKIIVKYVLQQGTCGKLPLTSAFIMQQPPLDISQEPETWHESAEGITIMVPMFPVHGVLKIWCQVDGMRQQSFGLKVSDMLTMPSRMDRVIDICRMEDRIYLLLRFGGTLTTLAPMVCTKVCFSECFWP